MKVNVSRITAKEWAEISETAHLLTFGEKRDAGKDRVDFAILAQDEKQTPIGYITVKELDRDTIYWQFGGAMPDYKSTNVPFIAYMAASKMCALQYKRVTTYIENSNTPMLRFAMKLGFKIIGMKQYGKHLLLEHLMEF